MEAFTARNPFGAPVYHTERTASTMDDARALAKGGAPHGTVVAADEQTAGRGRTAGRAWSSAPGESLLCTTILSFAHHGERFPRALTLRVGLAAVRALEDAVPALRGALRVKWPNDVLSAASGRKLCGILCESTGRSVLVGTGFNLLQASFPPELAAKASSVFLESGERPGREAVLEAFLIKLREELAEEGWKAAVEERLYLRGERVCFESGAADSGRLVRGVLRGIGDEGELRIAPEGESAERLFASGELRVYAGERE